MKRLKEDVTAPTNAMGTSSTTSGPIQTFDPLLNRRQDGIMRRRQILSRIKMIVKKTNGKRSGK